MVDGGRTESGFLVDDIGLDLHFCSLGQNKSSAASSRSGEDYLQYIGNNKMMSNRKDVDILPVM